MKSKRILIPETNIEYDTEDELAEALAQFLAKIYDLLPDHNADCGDSCMIDYEDEKDEVTEMEHDINISYIGFKLFQIEQQLGTMADMFTKLVEIEKEAWQKPNR